MEVVAYWLAVGLLLWLAWPALVVRRRRTVGVLLAVLVPVFSWAWLTWIGLEERARGDVQRVLEAEHAERLRVARDVAFWRDRARTGTPAEQEAARMYLEALGYAVQPGPAELHADQLATASTDTLAQMSRHYQAVLHSGNLGPDGRAAYQAVQHELARRREEARAEATRRGFRESASADGLAAVYLNGVTVRVTEEQAVRLSAQGANVVILHRGAHHR